VWIPLQRSDFVYEKGCFADVSLAMFLVLKLSVLALFERTRASFPAFLIRYLSY